ncbi:MAG: DUF1906 domain-containing protein [Microbacterium enclense]
MANPKVLEFQKWLNATYKTNSQWIKVPENEQPGWPTMYAATRALQIELGITSLSDSFGPATQARFTSQFGSLSPTTTAGKTRVIRILQGALWTKGYTGGWENGKFDAAVSSSISTVNADLGLSSAVMTVNAKLMKSLLTMDAYILIGAGTEAKRAAQQWLNARYSSRADFPLLPTDGLYSRNTQIGLMYGIQYELDMKDGVANGNFGPGTQSGLKANATVQLNSVDSGKRWVRLFQCALRFNDYPAPLSGKFDSATQEFTKSFQRYAELPQTGVGNYTTWAGLLVSTGDENRAGAASDMSTQLSAAQCALIYQKGYRTVGRYLTVDGKRYAPGELERIFAAGLKTFPIMQEDNTNENEFSRPKGLDHGFQAARRLRQLGFKEGTTVFFAVDFDAIDDQITSRILPYFRGVKYYLDRLSVKYKIGVYGTRNVCTRVIKEGLASEAFIASMSWGWSGNLGFSLPPSWSYDQIAGLTLSDSSASVEIDKNVQSSRATPAGSDSVYPTALRTTSAGTQFDEDYLWYFAENIVKAEAADPDGFPVDYVLRYIQRLEPNYQAPVWTLYAPASENDPIYLDRPVGWAQARRDARAAFEAIATAPADSQIPRMTHFAASLRGYLRWVWEEPTVWARTADLAGWAGDLVNAWNDYYANYRASSPSIRDWFKKNVGGPSSGRFSQEDLLCDVDAYLTRSLMASGMSFLESVRQIEYECSRDSTWRYREFAARRFGGSKANAAEGGASLFVHWIWVERALKEFLDEGVPAPSDAESKQIGLGFADALFARFK